jgi:hypothetical protein
VFLTLFGLVFAGFGFGLMYAAVMASRWKQKAEAKWSAQTDGGQKAWLARPEWAVGKIKSATGAQTKIFVIFAVAFLGIGGISTAAALPKELPKGNYLALLVLLFPVVGLGFLVAVIRGMLARRRFGDCFFELAQVPAPLGGTLDGEIQTARPLKLEQGLQLKLTCLRRTVSGSGDNRSTQESILWQDEKMFRNDASLPTNDSGGTGIPVHFQLPAEQPESSLRGNSTIIWRLEAKAKMAGPDFSAVFEVPVFRVAGTVLVAEPDKDPTAPLQMSVEEIRRDEHSKIQISDGPAGREFCIPAARNLGMAFSLTFFFLVWSAFTLAAYALFKSLFFEIVFTAVDVLVFVGCLNVWLKSSRVTVDSTGVTALNRWLLFSKSRRFAAGEIERFDTAIGMTSGNTAYYAIKLVKPGDRDDFAARKARYQQTGERPELKFAVRNPSGVTLASGIASKPEADWLVQEMTRALGRRI